MAKDYDQMTQIQQFELKSLTYDDRANADITADNRAEDRARDRKRRLGRNVLAVVGTTAALFGANQIMVDKSMNEPAHKAQIEQAQQLAQEAQTSEVINTGETPQTHIVEAEQQGQGTSGK